MIMSFDLSKIGPVKVDGNVSEMIEILKGLNLWPVNGSPASVRSGAETVKNADTAQDGALSSNNNIKINNEAYVSGNYPANFEEALIEPLTATTEEPKPTPEPISDELRYEILKLFDEGLTTKEIAAKLVRYSSWFLNARYSVLKEAGDSGPARYLKLYTDAGIITTRPHHPKFMEALAIVENAVSAFLSNQIKFGKTIQLIKDQIELL